MLCLLDDVKWEELEVEEFQVEFRDWIRDENRDDNREEYEGKSGW